MLGLAGVRRGWALDGRIAYLGGPHSLNLRLPQRVPRRCWTRGPQLLPQRGLGTCETGQCPPHRHFPQLGLPKLGGIRTLAAGERGAAPGKKNVARATYSSITLLSKLLNYLR